MMLIKRVKKWLRKPENTFTKLSLLLGYSSRSTVYNWIKREKIPQSAIPKLKEVLKGEK